MTKKIKIGNRFIGGDSPVLIQSMCNTRTNDVDATVNQILALEDVGCDIIRVAVPDAESAKAIEKIKSKISILPIKVYGRGAFSSLPFVVLGDDICYKKR